jgi:hypothetical protein
VHSSPFDDTIWIGTVLPRSREHAVHSGWGIR